VSINIGGRKSKESIKHETRIQQANYRTQWTA